MIQSERLGREQTRHDGLWLVIGIAAIALSLRPSVTSLPPLFPEIERHFKLSSITLSLFASTPVLCFGVFSVIAAPLARRFGEEAVLTGTLMGLAVGLALRASFSREMLFPGTILAAGSIAVMNVLLSSFIKRRDPRRAGLLLAIYVVGLSVGSVLGSAVSIPLLHASGGSWFVTFGFWSLPVVLALALWRPQLAHRQAREDMSVKETSTRALLKRPLSQQVVGFMALQSLAYYGLVSWLPTMLRSRGSSAVQAGYLLSLLSVGSVIAASLIPNLAHRFRDQRALVYASVAACLVGIVGLFLAPLGGAPGWTILLGLGQGSALSLALYFVIARSPNSSAAASLSGLAQGCGYLLASLGPLVVGVLHAETTSWMPSLALLLAVTVLEAFVGTLAARPIVVEL